MENKFYVYVHLRKDGTPFYVGKGSKDRAYTTASRSKWWKSVVKKEYGGKFPDVRFLENRLTEEQSLDREIFWIKKFGRKKIHPNGLLINHSDGGDGLKNPSDDIRNKIGSAMRGKKHSKETISKMSKSRSGINHPMYGKKHSADFCKKQSILKRGNKNMLGKKHSDAAKRKMSIAQMGKTIPNEVRNKISETLGAKPAYLLSPSGEKVLVTNQREFSRQYGLIPTKVSDLIRKKAQSHKGWTLYEQH